MEIYYIFLLRTLFNLLNKDKINGVCLDQFINQRFWQTYSAAIKSSQRARFSNSFQSIYIVNDMWFLLVTQQ